ncbi:NAD(P)-binding protein [Flavobacterium commune]|uniref:NAD(P)-binding protein n=1 Tax=Flavobacterium commune TaxID=1306519 RepID=UPI0009F300C0|nr:NAD(P)-binding protein [Flavobacterium commune]
MKSGENYKHSRRFFLKSIAASLLVIPFFQACQEKVITLLIRLSGTNHILGHRLRVKNFPKPTSQIHIPYLIVGGGISGLSAARQFSKKGIDDFLLIELENHLGGNSSNGENKYSKFPLGAHYLPLPNKQDKALFQFLEEEKIILGYDSKGFPEFDELQLTFAPDERLFYRNNWQEGLVPKTGNSLEDDIQFKKFFLKMDAFRAGKGIDGKYFFDIPLALSSNEESIRVLDTITMEQWFEKEGFNSKPLFDYIDYCCRDDFGLGIKYVSAWAGIHYFAARKQDATEDAKDNVLTWPEGNARLAHHLQKYAGNKTLKNHLVYEVKTTDGKVVATVFDAEEERTIEIIADKVIMATPQFVNQYIIKGGKTLAQNFHYAPWLLATLVVSDLRDNESFPLCWDNVIYGSKGLGYVYDQHQSLQQVQSKKVITYYHSFSSADVRKSRKDLYSKKSTYWKQLVFDDLKIAHPDIEKVTEEINIHLLGHGMISPVVGFIFGEAKKQAAQNIENKIFFAHSDLSGISIFEEAFHQGINIVNQIIDGSTLD